MPTKAPFSFTWPSSLLGLWSFLLRSRLCRAQEMISGRFYCSDAYEDAAATSTSRLCGEVGATNLRPSPRSPWRLIRMCRWGTSHLCSFYRRIWREKGKRQQQDRRERERIREKRSWQNVQTRGQLRRQKKGQWGQMEAAGLLEENPEMRQKEKGKGGHGDGTRREA